jgi:hypothetical protein
MSMVLNIANPFSRLEARRDEAIRASTDDRALRKTIAAEQAVSRDIIRQCLQMLHQLPELSEALEAWTKDKKVGLAWKRYDRLEWVQGANEQKMYGTIAMAKSHELELRPMQHYPTVVESVKDENSINPLEEPSPIEGFLIRLTSQRGRFQRFGRLFYKRLYFYTHNQYLCFCRPARAMPLPPPDMQLDPFTVPTASEVANRTPLIFDSTPYALDDNEITWLRPDQPPSHKQSHDRAAFDEADRKLNALKRAEGFIDLCNVTSVRSVIRGSTPADRNVGHGPDVPFQPDAPDTARDDGTVSEFDDDRTFELVLQNGLVIRLEAYNLTTKRAWMARLRDLVDYWRLRKAADLQLLKDVRTTNLDHFHIDEDTESHLGQFGQKWEVSGSVASSQLYHICGLDLCRTITYSGVLYHKLQRYSAFVRYHVILCPGQLLVFENALRKRTGTALPFSHHERHSTIDLADCYIYSGLITEADIPQQNQTFDSKHPGRHALPKIHPGDGWTSSDEDVATSFVIWCNTKKSFFRSSSSLSDDTVASQVQPRKKTILKKVSQLGKEGRTMIFKARSRAERDLWVMAISTEIERLQVDTHDDYRLVE